MSSDPLPDHYKALGVDKSADTSAIKSAHRKLVLKCHPDKFPDPTLKAQKQEEFHKIQQAYEVLVDDDKRADYEAHLTLDRLRKEKAARGPAPSERSARFDVRTSGGATYTATSASRYTTEERKPTSRSYEDDRQYEERSRSKYDTYDAFPKTGSSPRTREKESSKSTRTQDRTRSDRVKTRDREVRSEREARSDRKFPLESESSADEKYAFQTEYKRRSEHDEARKKSAEAMRKAEDRRSYEDNRYPGSTSSHRKMSVQEEAARAYQHKYKGQVQAEMESPSRPSLGRTSSRDYYGESRSSRKETRPEIRRSSAARSSKDRPSSSGLDRDRGVPEIVEWSKPAFKHSSSSPANIEIPRAVPQRSRTDYDPREHRRTENSPPPAFHRSATMPTVPTSSSSRRKETRPSMLRETMTPEHSSPERDAYPKVPAPQTTTRTRVYRYPDEATKPRTVLVEPERHQRSPEPMYREPMSRPPIGPNRPSETTSSSKYVPQVPVPPNSSKTRSSARHASPVRMPEQRGRLYGEIGSDRRGRQSSFSPSRVSYTPRYGPEDIRWAPQAGGERGREFSKPSFSRTNTLPVY